MSNACWSSHGDGLSKKASCVLSSSPFEFTWYGARLIGANYQIDSQNCQEDTRYSTLHYCGKLGFPVRLSPTIFYTTISWEKRALNADGCYHFHVLSNQIKHDHDEIRHEIQETPCWSSENTINERLSNDSEKQEQTTIISEEIISAE